MALKTGRREFLQSVAVTAALPGAACSESSTEGNSETSHVDSQGTTGDLDSASTTGVGPQVGPSTSAAPQDTTEGTSANSTTSTSSEDTGTASDTATSAADSSSSASATTTGTSGEGQTTAPPRPTSPLGVALLGLGKYAGERLAPALQLTQHCRLVGIVTGTPSKVAEWQSAYGIEDKNVYTYDTMDALIDNPDIHVVYVVTPNHVHPEFVMRAARAKKHVWCEKPMAMTVEECQAMIDVCNENGVTLSIGYRLQHEPNTQTFMSYADTKPFGAITEVQALAGFSGFSPAEADVWRLKRAPGGGALFDMGVYCINGARYALGEEPIRVRQATQWTDRPDLFTEVDEFTDFVLEFPSGALAWCRTSFGERMDALEVSCERGAYSLEPFQAYTGVSGGASDGALFNLPIENQQAKQMDDDALSIIEGRPQLVPGEEGLRDVRIVLAIVQAAETEAPVELV